MSIELLSLIDKTDEEIITNFREIGSGFSRTHANWANTPNWLTSWGYAKSEYLNKIFGQNLILTKEISYRMDIAEIANEIEWSLLGWNSEQKYKQFFDTFTRAFNYLRNDRDTFNQYYAVTSLISSSNLASNCFHHGGVEPRSYIDITLPNQDKPFRLQDGAKVSRTIGKLCTLMNIPGWEDVRLKVSQILNTATIHGELCLSIHPMDFLTASVNNNGWNSCMDFYDGEYRRGVIEMMNSPNVIVAYLKSADKTVSLNNGYEWNSKRWREFFIVDPRGIFAIKGYPYWNRELETDVISWVRDLIVANNVFPTITFSNTVTDYTLDEKVKVDDLGSTFSMRHVSISCGPAMYNDFYEPNHYMACFSSHMMEDTDYESIFYSGESTCAVCGKYDGFNDEDDGCEGHIVCEECYPTVECYRCGGHYDPVDMYEVNNHYYCPGCYDCLPVCNMCDNVFDQDINGEVDFTILAKEVSAHIDKQVTVTSLTPILCVCGNCMEHFFRPDAMMRRFSRWSWSNNYYLLLEDINADGKNILFGTDDDEEILQQFSDSQDIKPLTF